MDGADLLGWLAWQRLRWQSRRWAGMVVTSHQRRLLPPLWHCRTSPDLLARLLAGLMGDLSAQWEPLAREHFATRHGNLRLVFRDLYDVAADRGGRVGKTR